MSQNEEEEYENEYEEDSSDPHMNQKSIRECCIEHGLYKIPDLNDVLHLECKMFPAIHGLKKYVNLKELWLNGNQITVIRGLDTLTQLTSLYLHDNLIGEITGLEKLENLRILSLSGNIIKRISGLEGCPHLLSLDLDRNRLIYEDSLNGLRCCKELQILHLINNGIEEPSALDAFDDLPSLRALHVDGNPVVRKIRNYRKVLISKYPQLTYLDDAPIRESEHRTVDAWVRGGKEAEMEERHKIRSEIDAKEWEDIKALRHLQKERAIAEGKDLKDFPELLSDDDELPRKIKPLVRPKDRQPQEQPIVEAPEPKRTVQITEVKEEIDLDDVD